MSSQESPKRPLRAAEIPLDLLRRMARPGATAETAGPGGHMAVRSTRHAGTGELQSIPSEHWNWAIRERAIAHEPGTSTWRLTAHGRSILRRHLSTPAQSRAARTPAASPPAPQLNQAESPLAWLRQRKDRDGAPLISDQQFRAGERLREDFERAHLNPRVTINWDGIPSSSGPRAAPGIGIEIQDAVLAARKRVHHALQSVGPELSGILLDVCCHLKGLEGVEKTAGWPQRSARIVLLLALTRLARHYGFEQPASPPAARIRHWGAGGYRPAIAQSGPHICDPEP